MDIFELTLENAPLVAKLMARIKPEWWSFDDALKSITAPEIVGWYMGESSDAPLGFIHIKELVGYNCVELENYGCDDDGVFHVEEKMTVLFDRVEQYALEKGFRSVRVTITYHKAFSHDKKVINYAEELLNIESKGSHFEYMLSRGYRPAGFIPDCYGVDFHGLMILKYLV